MKRGEIYVLIALLAIGCRQDAGLVNRQVVNEQMARSSNAWNRQLRDSAITLLHSGDMVMRMGIDVSSYMLAQMNQENKDYSHCGLVMIENGYPFVYHSIGGEDNPDARMRRDSASFFFSPGNNTALGIVRYDMPDTAKAALHRIVRRLYKEGKMFDMNFDIHTDDRLYCAEMVYKAVNEAMRDGNYIRPVRVFSYTFVGIDNLFLNPHAKVIWQIKYK